MRKILLIFTLIPVMIFSQEANQGQSIELPEFVITGKQTVTVPKALKKKPDPISIVSPEFFTPTVSTEQFSLSDISEPFMPQIILYPISKYINGQLEVGAGVHTIPTGKFNIQQAFESSVIFANVSGLNINEYENNSQYNETAAGAGAMFFISSDSDFLSGSSISVNGNYYQNSYRFFASANPEFERKTQTYNAKLKFENQASSIFNYNFSTSFENLTFKENDLSEILIRPSLDIKFNVGSTALLFGGLLENQSLKNNLSTITSYNYFSAYGKFRYNISNGIILDAGASYYKSENEDLVTPVAKLTTKLNKNLTLFVEYNPTLKNKTFKHFLEQNRYFNFGAMDNFSEKDKFKIKGAVRYQFDKYFEINLGGAFSKIDNYLYFGDVTTQGFYDLRNDDEIKKIEGFLNLIFYQGPFGMFYADFIYNSVKFENGNYVPFEPEYKANAFYKYKFDFGFGIEPSLRYYSKSYVNINNNGQISDYINAAVKGTFNLLNNLELFVEFQNLLNRNNYLLPGYTEKPFDVLGGVKYSW
ncbi:MAG: hypothetical protein J5I57_01185 [Melioribacteraceae bacterium]|nr:hypothetical protein [Melioribacteraceae bacterium]